MALLHLNKTDCAKILNHLSLFTHNVHDDVYAALLINLGDFIQHEYKTFFLISDFSFSLLVLKYQEEQLYLKNQDERFSPSELNSNFQEFLNVVRLAIV